MKKTVFALVFVLLAGVAWAGLAFWSGKGLEQTQDALWRDAARQHPILARIGRQYRRGTFGSTQVLSIPLGAGGNEPLIITEHLRHGPVPGLAIAAARSTVTFQWPQSLQSRIAGYYGDKPPIEARITYGYGGDVRYDGLLTPMQGAVNVDAGKSAYVHWQGGRFSGKVHGLQRHELQMAGEGLALKTVEGDFRFGPWRWDADLRKGPADLPVGDGRFEIEGLDFAPHGKPEARFAAARFGFDASASGSGDLLEVLGTYRLGTMRVGGVEHGDAEFGVGIRRLHAPSYRRLLDVYNGIRADLLAAQMAAGAGTKVQPTAESFQPLVAVLKEILPVLLQQDPLVQVDAAWAVGPAARAQAHMDARLTALDLGLVQQHPESLLQKLLLDLDGSADGAWFEAVRVLAARNPEAAAFDPEALTAQGLLQKSADGKFTVALRYAGGRLTINGREAQF